MSGLSPYEQDIAAQPEALQAFIKAAQSGGLEHRPALGYGRVVITGMGSSHFAGHRTWRRLIAAGVPAWWIDTSALLAAPRLVTEDTLLIVTSQSGASGEVTALFDELEGSGLAPDVIGVTNDLTSPLAEAASTVVPLHSGREATVSTKSYVNSLAVQEVLTAVLLEEDTERAIRDLAEGVAALGPDSGMGAEMGADAYLPGVRLTFIGGGDHLATALFGGLIVKEATKIPAEGFSAGNFRHGPLELAGPGMVAFVFGVGEGTAAEPLRRLARDIAATGSSVVTFGEASIEGCQSVAASAYEGFAGLVGGANLCHSICVQVARGRGMVPGEFHYGQKVTGL